MAPQPSLSDVYPALEPLAPPRVLVADDDDGIRGMLGAWLEGEGMLVETVGSGREAITRLQAAPLDLVVLDVEMPGTPGLDVLGFIREHRMDTAVIITTAYGSEDIVAQALRRGADDYLRKPFDWADVQAAFDRTIARLMLSRQNAALRAGIEGHKQHLEKELARAAEVVAELLPLAPPEMRGFELAAACLSSRDVGGDFYDWEELAPGALSLTVGDVMGKGLPAALLMATARAVLRAVVRANDTVGVVQCTAQALDSDLARSGAFITLFHAQIDLNTGDVRYVDAGHGYVLLRRENGFVEELKPWGLPLGVDSNERYQSGLVRMQPGDTLVVYSDGLTEARPDLFSHREAVAAFVAHSIEPDAIVKNLRKEVAHIKPLPDDLTIVVLRRQPVAAAV